MARIYAGVLGPLALLVSLIRGIVQGGGPENVIGTALCSLLAFAAVGYVIGWIAQWTIDDSVNGRLLAELAARQATRVDAEAAANGREA